MSLPPFLSPMQSLDRRQNPRNPPGSSPPIAAKLLWSPAPRRPFNPSTPTVVELQAQQGFSSLSEGNRRLIEERHKRKMRMEKSHSSDTQSEGGKAPTVLAIECVVGSSKADEWNLDMLQTGDIVEEITIGGFPAVKYPFKGGRGGVQKLLHSAFKRGETSISVRVRRGEDESLELHACVVPHEPAGRKQYVLRSIHDPNYAVTFVDLTESECAELQGSRSSRVACALSKAQLQDGFVFYRWEKKMKASLPIQNSSSFLSLLILPKAADPSGTRYNCLEDTLARANAWLNSAQASGVPIVFMNVQSEALLTKVSGETASATVTSGSLNDLCNLANASLYGFEDYHGVDIGVVRGIRLWYAAFAGEYPVEIKLLERDSRLGFAVSRTEEGFIYVSSVVDDDDNGVPSTRSGLRDLYKAATRASKLLVISRVSNEKVLPWMVSTSGAVRCYDTVSLSQKLSLHRHALQPILLHVLLWEQRFITPSGGSRRAVIPPVAPAPPSPPHPPAAERGREQMSPPVELVKNLSLTRTLLRDTAGEVSLRFHDFSLPNSWV